MRPLSSLPNLARNMMFKPKYRPIVISSTKTEKLPMITHNQLMRYMALQHIGIVNMNDHEAVRDLTGLRIEDIKYIQENYKALTEEELPPNAWEITRDIIQAIPINDYPIKL